MARERAVRAKIAAQKKADAEERDRERMREEETREKIQGALGDLLIKGDGDLRKDGSRDGADQGENGER